MPLRPNLTNNLTGGKKQTVTASEQITTHRCHLEGNNAAVSRAYEGYQRPIPAHQMQDARGETTTTLTLQ